MEQYPSIEKARIAGSLGKLGHKVLDMLVDAALTVGTVFGPEATGQQVYPTHEGNNLNGGQEPDYRDVKQQAVEN